MAQPAIILKIACRAGILGFAAGKYRQVQRLIYFPDVVFPAQSPQAFSGVVHKSCINGRQTRP